MSEATILVIEDDADIREILEYTLTREGYSVRSADDGLRGLSEARKLLPELVLLDLILPGMDGLELCRKLKSGQETSGIAIIMVTAKGEESDIVLGLGLGADDYVHKPFRRRELVARVQAVLRRAGAPPAAENSVLQRGCLRIDPSRHQVSCGGDDLVLTATEFRMLFLMARQPGRVFTREQILAAVRGETAVSMERSVDAHIRAIRKKLGRHRDLVETVRSIGYRLRD